MPNVTTTTFTLQSDKTYTIKPEPKHRLRYSSIGLLNMLNERYPQPDLLDLLGALNKGPRDFFILLKNLTNHRTGTAYLDPSKLSKGQLNKRSSAYRELTKHDLVRRVPSTGIINPEGVELHFPVGTYMISPEFILPYSDYRESILHLWSQVK